jgi:hypothetical protein
MLCGAVSNKKKRKKIQFVWKSIKKKIIAIVRRLCLCNLHCQCPKSNNIFPMHFLCIVQPNSLRICIIQFKQFIPEISCSQNHTSRNLLAHFQLCSVEWPDIVAISVDIVVVRAILCSFLRLFYESFRLRQELLHTLSLTHRPVLTVIESTLRGSVFFCVFLNKFLRFSFNLLRGSFL